MAAATAATKPTTDPNCVAARVAAPEPERLRSVVFTVVVTHIKNCSVAVQFARELPAGGAVCAVIVAAHAVSLRHAAD